MLDDLLIRSFPFAKGFPLESHLRGAEIKAERTEGANASYERGNANA
jgi:hypothetical protein